MGRRENPATAGGRASKKPTKAAALGSWKLNPYTRQEQGLPRGLNPARHDDDTDSWRHVAKVVDDSGQVRAVGLRVIARRLADAAEGDGREALASFQEADAIRRQIGLSWDQAVASGTASGFSPKGAA